jgi:multidrug efflux system membrane fusion protein
VDVTVLLGVQRDAVVVPSQALQTGQQGPYVYVVTPDLTVENRAVTLGRTVDGETVVEKGIQPNEMVVTDGQLRLLPGARVEIKKGPDSAPRPVS